MRKSIDKPLFFLRRRERTAMLVLYLLIIGTMLFTAHLLNQLRQSREFDSGTAAVVNRLDTDIAEVHTMLVSLVNLHHTSDNTDLMDLSLLAEQFQERSPHVVRLGRFDQVPDEDREDYERWMSENSILNYRIREPDDRGRLQVRPTQDHYYPISLLEPRTPQELRLIGLDVGSDPALVARLTTAMHSDEGFFATVPPSWPLAHHLLAIQPAYLGNRHPERAEQRREQFDGGYWLSIDVAGLLADLPLPDRSRLTLSLRGPGGEPTILSSLNGESGTDHLSYFTALHRPLVREQSWQFGDSTLSLEIVYPPGIAAVTLIVVALLALVTTLLFLLLAMNICQRRAADHGRIRSLHQLNRERERAELTLNAISDAVIAVDVQGRIRHANSAAERLIGRSNDDLHKVPIDELLTFEYARDRDGRMDLVGTLSALPCGGKVDHDVRTWHHAGRSGPVRRPDDNQVTKLTLSRSKAPSADGRESFILVLRDVSHERKLSRDLEYQASHDALTGCFNRYYFEKRLSRLVEDVHASHREHALVYFDLDQFKIVNDTCGHPAGDRLLKELTENLHSIIRRSDVLARLGGDEFGLIVLDTSQEHAERVAHKLYDFFQTYTFYHERKAFPIRASIGFVPINAKSGTLHDIMSAADIACYASKDGGRNALHLYSEDDEALSKRQQDLNWLPRLRHALDNDQFRMLIQPLATIRPDSEELEITHYEFLIRLIDSEGNEITPYQFISAAERYDLMAEIDRWVIDRAIQQVGDHYRHGRFLGKTFSINLSGQSAADPELASYIRNCFHRHDVAADLFWFEITETAAISHFSIARQLFEDLRAMGSRVVLDDFGSGLSSFGYLKNLPVDVLKIDGQFIRNLADNPIDQEMVRAIHGVARAMGIATVAEFVENQAIVDCLRDIGVDFAQGYYISKPGTFPQAERDWEGRQAA